MEALTPTKDQVKAGLAIILAASETIREAGQVPAGTLYAALMAKGCDYQTYTKIEGILTGSGMVTKRGDLLVWTGPMLSEARS